MNRPSPRYGRRIIDEDLDVLVAGLPAVAIEGAKAVGKTATASQRARTTISLDRPHQRVLVETDLERVVRSPRPVLLDEWQYLPEVWDVVRHAVDGGAPPGSFILAGSSSPAGTDTHSGAGRIVRLRMRPLALAERLDEPSTVSLAQLLKGGGGPVGGVSPLDLQGYTEEILRSGFPGVRDLSGRLLRAQLDAYVDRVVDRDFAELGHELRRPDALRRWLTAYAAASSTTASFEAIRDASTGGNADKPSREATLPYRDVLERLFVLDAVPPWLSTRRRIAELGRPPKHHLADPALAAHLLGANADSLLTGRPTGPSVPRDGPLLGALFESLVTLSVRVYAQAAEARVGHLRTHRGEHEVDLIVERSDGAVVAMEVKLRAVPDDDDVRHLHWLRRHLGEDLLDAVVITTGTEAYRRRDGIAVVPAALLGP